ncbi:hypothetical protein TI39_contig353g00002 [Zymoseptoria brevis]|uniref:Uncharacterized protein n=1 Tax=Zymoseptoria brevis TaxID=1047168 RepID=A0A0F4GQM0_9PEZI|nr:hypothetical protein TI39_contig353g00002 [Zymoseptoria brevis]
MSYHEQHYTGFEGATKRKRPSQESSFEDIPWTAARCNRLLRTITSRTTALRRLLDTCARNDGNTAKRNPLREKREDEHWSTTDPVWLPDGKRKAPGRTYAAKPKLDKNAAQKTSLKVTSTGLTFPSPFVRRIGCSNPLDYTGSPVAALRERPPPAQRSRQLAMKPESRITEANQGLVTAFTCLLAVTSQRKPPRIAGASSLMSMCLRQVPAYIELNEEFESGEALTSEIFSYLEQFGVREDGGWSGLREVVRSQAVHIIRAAFVEGVVLKGTISQLIDVCGEQSAILEGFQLLQTWLETTEPLSSAHSGALSAFGRQHQCRELTFRTMHMLGHRKPARLAMLSKSSEFWKDLLRSLSGSSGHHAADLLGHHVQHILEQEGDASSSITNDVREMIFKLTAMAASSALLDRKDTFIHRTISRLAADATYSFLEQRERASIHRDIHPLTVLLVESALLLSGISPESQSRSTALNLETLGRLSSFMNQDPHARRDDFAEKLAEDIVDLQRHLCLPLIEPLIERMLGMPTALAVFQRVGLAALTAKRQHSGDTLNESDYHDILKRLATTSERRPKTPQTPFRKNANPGYRWEDGICEWVAATPFTKAASPINLSSDDSTMAHFISTPATEISHMATPDKENQAPVSKNTLAVHKVALRPPSSAKPEQSPDILAMTPQLKRLAESPTRPAQKRPRMSRTSSTTNVQLNRRVSISGTALYPDEDDSADELGF